MSDLVGKMPELDERRLETREREWFYPPSGQQGSQYPGLLMGPKEAYVQLLDGTRLYCTSKEGAKALQQVLALFVVKQWRLEATASDSWTPPAIEKLRDDRERLRRLWLAEHELKERAFENYFRGLGPGQGRGSRQEYLRQRQVTDAAFSAFQRVDCLIADYELGLVEDRVGTAP